MKNIYQSAIIGLGKIGSSYPSKGAPRTHTEAHLKNKKINVGAGVDPSKNARKDFSKRWGHKIPVFSSVKEMLYKIQPDIASICVPTSKLVDTVKEFSKKPPKLYFLEKPVVNNFDNLKNIITAINNIPTAVNYHRCWDPSHSLFFKKILKSGKVISLRIIYNKGMFNYSSHIIALLIHHFGNVSSVRKLKSQTHNIKNLDPSFSFILNFKCGIQAIFLGFDIIKYDLLELEMITTSGIYSIKSAGCRKRQEIPKKNIFYPNYVQLIDVPYHEQDRQVEGLTQAINNIVNFLDGKDKKLSCNLALSLKVSSIMSKIKNKN
jgi:predicted dehydrogenase